MKQRKAASLTTRLGLLFALIASITFASVGIYLYQTLAAQLEASEDAGLLEKIGHVRHLLQETPSVITIVADPHRFVDAAAGYEGLILVLKDTNGKILMQNHPELSALPTLPAAPANQAPDLSLARSWPTATGEPGRGVSAWGALGGGSAEQVQIVVGRTASARTALLTAYRAKVLAGVLSGALLAASFGYLLVQRGLRPLHVIADQAHSITAQKLDRRLDVASAPSELQMLVEAFNAMFDRLHNSFQRLSQFSADLAHDLRTPINNLMVQTQVALSQPRSLEDYQALLASNVEEYERLARMVENMLFLARADHAQVALESKQLDSRTELQRIADYFEGVAEDVGVRLMVEANDTVTADPFLFRRAVNNLVANAIRYTPAGEAILLSTQQSSGMTVVSVVNPGPGIPAEHLPRLFDRFYRTDVARSDSASSTGLGLAIVQSIMQLHGGWTEVDSAHGTTTFRLLFPVLIEPE